jgi:predicted transcriptional regulator of viral defense system
MRKSRTALEEEAIAFAQERGNQFVRAGELATALQLSPLQEKRLLFELTRKPLIASVRDGLYLFPKKTPLGGIWTPDEATAINALMVDCGGQYQITGLSAFKRYGYSNQMAVRATIYNDMVRGDRRVGNVEMTLVKVRDERLGDTESYCTADGERIIFSSRARTLVDAVSDWQRFDTLPEAYQWIYRDISKGRVTAWELALSAVQYGGRNAVRRIGAMLQEMGVSEAVLSRLDKAVGRTRNPLLFVPSGVKIGKLANRWGVTLNNRRNPIASI